LAPSCRMWLLRRPAVRSGRSMLRIIEKFFADLRGHIDGHTRELAEADLARIATGLGPTQFRAAAERLGVSAQSGW